MTIEVRIGGRGSVRDGEPTLDTTQVSGCDLCGQEADAVASTSVSGGAPFACKACLRIRLEAMTVGAYLLREQVPARGEGPEVGPTSAAKGGLPWGKVSG